VHFATQFHTSPPDLFELNFNSSLITSCSSTTISFFHFFLGLDCATTHTVAVVIVARLSHFVLMKQKKKLQLYRADFFLKTHDFLQPLGRPSSPPPSQQPAVEKPLNALPGGVGTFSISRPAADLPGAVKQEPAFALWGQPEPRGMHRSIRSRFRHPLTPVWLLTATRRLPGCRREVRAAPRTSPTRAARTATASEDACAGGWPPAEACTFRGRLAATCG
jgi:hypothetical protein